MNIALGTVLELFRQLSTALNFECDENKHKNFIENLEKLAIDASASKLDYKGHGRIFVINAVTINDITNMKNIVETTLKELDAFEYEYLPDDYITDISESKDLTYTGKFDPNCKKLIEKCLEKGVVILIVSIPSSMEIM